MIDAKYLEPGELITKGDLTTALADYPDDAPMVINVDGSVFVLSAQEIELSMLEDTEEVQLRLSGY